MSRAVTLRVATVLAIVAVLLWISVTEPLRKAPGLRGGTQVVLEARDTPEAMPLATTAGRGSGGAGGAGSST